MERGSSAVLVLLERVQATPKGTLGDQAAIAKSTPSARCAKAIQCEYDACARHRNDRRLEGP
jgi:hypothetical protein